VGVNSDSIAGRGDQKQPFDCAEEQSELEAVLESKTFARAPNLAAILRYVCQEYCQGRANLIKEYNIAVQALGRAEGFDPSQDSVVRVEVSRLRKRLQQFYETEGASHKIHLQLAEVGYVPRFVRQPQPQSNGLETISGTAQVAAAAVDEPAEQSAGLAASARAATPQKRLMLFLAVLAVASTVSVLVMALRDRPSSAGFAPRTPAAMAPVAAPPADAVRISVGSLEQKYVDQSGRIWLGDRYFTGGAVMEKPDRTIFRTLDPALYRKAREGDCQYDIPLKPGVYELHLHFAELASHGSSGVGDEGERRFSVSLNGQPILANFDIVADAPGTETADERVFKDVSPAQDGQLHLRFSSLNNKPLLSGIEVLPGIPHRMLPIRILTGYRKFYDRKGQYWGADRYFWGGHATLCRYPISADDEPGLYNGDRYGNFTYYIPVAADGQYAVTLRFAESNYGKENQGGVGSRVFDVYCNGTTLLKNFDVFKEAGMACQGVKRTFHRLKPNAQGKLVLAFVPVVDYATVRAIEVEDDTRVEKR
jgi:hypothetical protein